MHVCMYVCMSVCMYVCCVYITKQIHNYVCIYIFIYPCHVCIKNQAAGPLHEVHGAARKAVGSATGPLKLVTERALGLA